MTGLPAGATGTFEKNPLTPPAGSSVNTHLNITTSTATPPGTYTLTITGISRGELSLKHSKTVKLIIKGSECPALSVSIAASPSSGPPPLSVQFTSQVTESPPGESKEAEGYTYLWAFGDSATSTEANPRHTYEKAGTYTATLTVKNDCGNSATDKITLSASAFSGTLSKKFSPSSVLPGEETVIILTIHNTSKSDFSEVTVRDKIPEELEILRTKGPVRPNRSGNTLTWIFDKIARRETVTLEVRCKVRETTRPGKISNTATLAHATLAHPVSSTATLRIGIPDVKIEKTVNLSTARPGDRLIYTLKVLNRSATPLTGLEITDTLSDNLEFVSQDSPYTFERNGNQLTWRGTLKANAVDEIRIVTKIKWTVFSGTRISNIAYLTTETGQVKKHSETVWTTISATALSSSKISFRKKAEIPQVDVGKILRFRLTLVNNSGGPLPAPVIDDYFPQGFSYVKGTTVLNGKLYRDPAGKGRHIHWALPLIAPGETAILKYQTIIGADARRGKNVNRAILSVTDNTGQALRIEAKAFVSVSALSFTFYSAVEGYVFLDRDGDGALTGKDPPLPDIEVMLSTGRAQQTDPEGRFYFNDLYAGEYLVGINTARLPDKYKLVSASPLPVILMAGMTEYTEFLVALRQKPFAALSGRVFYDKNSDKTFQEREPVPRTFQAILDATLRTTGKNGRFRFSHLKPGRHTVEIRSSGRSRSLSVDIKAPTTEVDIPLIYHRLTITIQKGKK